MLKYTKPFPRAVSYLISNVDACLEALPECLQPWGWDWLGNHLLQPIGEPGEHTTSHTAREGCESSWECHPGHPSPQQKAKSQANHVARRAQEPYLSNTELESAETTKVTFFSFSSMAAGENKARSYHHSGSPQEARQEWDRRVKEH